MGNEDTAPALVGADILWRALDRGAPEHAEARGYVLKTGGGELRRQRLSQNRLRPSHRRTARCPLECAGRAKRRRRFGCRATVARATAYLLPFHPKRRRAFRRTADHRTPKGLSAVRGPQAGSPAICTDGILALTLLLVGITAGTAEAVVQLCRPDELAAAIASAKPGDRIIMANGVWRDAQIVFEAKGKPRRPITLAAESAGKVVLTGESCLVVKGKHLVVEGLWFRDGTTRVSRPDGKIFRRRHVVAGGHCRVAHCAVTDYNPPDQIRKTHYYNWVLIAGHDHRVHNCFFRGQTHLGNTVRIAVERQPPGCHLIDHNYFAGRPRLGRNGGETILIGLSSNSMHNSRTVVEHNLFENCDGEIEIISNKSCENTYRQNTFVNCAGQLTLRHGDRCMVEGNVILGKGKPGSSGIRVTGEGHRVVDNYIAGTDAYGVTLQSGWPEAELSKYRQVRGLLLASNTFVHIAGPCIDLGLNHKPGRLLPTDCTIVNNVMLSHGPAVIRRAGECHDLRWQSNIAYGGPLGIPQLDGIALIDPELKRGEDGLLRPAADGPAIKVSRDPIATRPLTSADVGPDWMRWVVPV